MAGLTASPCPETEAASHHKIKTDTDVNEPSSAAQNHQAGKPFSKPSARSKRPTRPRVKTEPQPEDSASDSADQVAMPSMVKRESVEEDSGYSSSERKYKHKAKRARSSARDASSQQKPRKGDSTKAPYFTTEEDALLVDLHAKHNGDFKVIFAEFNGIRGRSLKQLRTRWCNYNATQKKRQLRNE
ncbi:hypothetical protein HDU87_001434 [Geranomyces variabilis]|uniref:HTH myb-type domain-containing protein n=1 Tax=Geranomyces variabilis TaxID=109894 RepID=A0AAD5TBN2_9FUNG|nr:hypothetical protein HDU87_001434 [Geranomyces variabilis]